eukprot:TRINITY_DN5816_c0_g2_i1.p1 TRINITY_DN5816_c0_g2~~TRINITY_DN5816_c0_g2_i1.p1  ORF type:complete len:284 (-),score=36.28 TRINITY_DN5816_c0_g2_i1:126-908(-)
MFRFRTNYEKLFEETSAQILEHSNAQVDPQLLQELKRSLKTEEEYCQAMDFLVSMFIPPAQLDHVEVETFSYVNEDLLPENLLCPLCECPFVEPVEHPISGKGGCSQIFCKECVKAQITCPYCCSCVSTWNRLQNSPANQRFLFGPLSELPVYCPTCNDSVPRGQLKYHVRSCTKPSSTGSGIDVTPKHQKLDLHRDDVITYCSARSVKCNWAGLQKDKLKHETECAFVKLQPFLKSLLDKINEQELVIAKQHEQLKNQK